MCSRSDDPSGWTINHEAWREGWVNHVKLRGETCFPRACETGCPHDRRWMVSEDSAMPYPTSEPNRSQKDANGRDLMYPGPNGRDLHYRGKPVYAQDHGFTGECCEMPVWVHATPDVYGPDGVPLDGPRTTAAEYADEIASNGYLRATWASVHWRNAAAYEGDRYMEALLGAREMRARSAAFLRVNPELAIDAWCVYAHGQSKQACGILSGPDMSVRYVTKPCLYCHEASIIDIDGAGYVDWSMRRATVQQAFPEMPKEEREMLLTGTHPRCWVALFGTDDDPLFV